MSGHAFSECPSCGTGFVGTARSRVLVHRAICGLETLLVLGAVVAGVAWLILS